MIPRERDPQPPAPGAQVAARLRRQGGGHPCQPRAGQFHVTDLLIVPRRGDGQSDPDQVPVGPYRRGRACPAPLGHDPEQGQLDDVGDYGYLRRGHALVPRSGVHGQRTGEQPGRPPLEDRGHRAGLSGGAAGEPAQRGRRRVQPLEYAVENPRRQGRVRSVQELEFEAGREDLLHRAVVQVGDQRTLFLRAQQAVHGEQQPGRRLTFGRRTLRPARRASNRGGQPTGIGPRQRPRAGPRPAGLADGLEQVRYAERLGQERGALRKPVRDSATEQYASRGGRPILRPEFFH